ncbi:hypothetical protein [Sinorhizobium fredii]|uniref:hypothetical protein n=1 Tax=Rhizobium fredii TaxID=380 RepID=UPI0035186A5C
MKAADRIDDTVFEFLLDTFEEIDPLENADLRSQLAIALWQCVNRRAKFTHELSNGGIRGVSGIDKNCP